MLGNRWREVPHFPHVLRTSVADLHICRLQAYGFIDSFTNSLNPTIESLQNKIKRWLNAEVTSSLGPAGRSCSCARPAPGGRARAQAPFTARPPGCCAHARAPARRARACTSSRSLPAGPTYSRNPLRPLTPATSGGGAAVRPGDRPSPAPRRRDAASSSLRWPCPGPASPSGASG